MIIYKQLLFTTLLATVSVLCQAQVGVKKSGIRSTQRAEETTPITNAVTGQRLTMEQYGELIKDDAYAWHLVPDYNEHGQPSGYMMRQATAEEHETHRFRDRDPAKQPKVGQTIAPFVMTGQDGKTYRSADLLGRVVVLSFWVSLDKPFWTDQQAQDVASALQPYPAQSGPLVLGVLNSEQPSVAEHLNIKALPFVPVPNAYGFHNKYHITVVPTIVVIDKTGKVAANLQGVGIYEKLKQILATVML